MVVHEDEADRLGHGRAPCGSVGGGPPTGRRPRTPVRRAARRTAPPRPARPRWPRRPGCPGCPGCRGARLSGVSGVGQRRSVWSGRAGHRQGQGDLGPVVQPAQPRGAAVAPHPADDRLADAEPVGGHGVDVEAGPVVADVRLDDLRADLDVGRDRRLGVPHGVEQRLPQRADQRGAALIQRPVAGDDELDGDAVEVLHLVRHLGDRGGEALLGAARAGVQPAAQLTLLGAGEAGHLGGVVGLALDQGEGLQDGVVQVRGDVGPLGLADPFGLLVAEGVPEPDGPRRGDQHRPREDRDRRDAHVPQTRQPPALGGEDDDAHGGQRHTEPEPDQALTPGGPAPGEPAVALGAVELGPGEDRADGHGQQRDEHPEAQVEPGLLGEQRHAQDHQAGADPELAQGLAGHPAAAGHRHRGALRRARRRTQLRHGQRLRRECPQGQVGRDAGAPRKVAPTKASRTCHTCCERWSARPAHTPPTTRPSTGRRSRGCSGSSAAREGGTYGVCTSPILAHERPLDPARPHLRGVSGSAQGRPSWRRPRPGRPRSGP